MASFRRTSEQGSGLLFSGIQGVIDTITVTVFSGSGFGTGSYEVHLYDAANPQGIPFLDANLSTTGTESTNFNVLRNIRSGYVYVAMTGSGAVISNLR